MMNLSKFILIKRYWIELQPIATTKFVAKLCHFQNLSPIKKFKLSYNYWLYPNL